jgi:hypothetical protein
VTRRCEHASRERVDNPAVWRARHAADANPKKNTLGEKTVGGTSAWNSAGAFMVARRFGKPRRPQNRK